MGKRIILADTEETVLSALELKFIFELRSMAEQIDIEIISDTVFFNEYFTTPRKADVLICGESMYSQDLRRHDIGKIFILCEGQTEGKTEELNTVRINKYSTNPGTILARAMKEFGDGFTITNADTIVALVYSANGGAGKTTIAMGICRKLADDYKKVLYINAERINSFQACLGSQFTIPNSSVGELSTLSGDSFSKLKKIIKNDGFDYLPPFSAALSSLGLSFSVYEKIIEAAKKSKEYDVIVVDTDSVYDEEKARLITNADRVLLIANKTRFSIFSLNRLLSNINYSNSAKYFFVWNDKENNDEEHILMNDIKPEFVTSSGVAYIEPQQRIHLSEIALRGDIQKTAYLLI